MRHCWNVCFLALLCASLADAQQGHVVATCDFEGPYHENSQGDRIQAGCINNYSWGRKDMSLQPDEGGHTGTCQRIEIRGISSGALQFFALANAFPVHAGRFYRVSWWMRGTPGMAEVYAGVRRMGYPWTMVVPGEHLTPELQWRPCSFVRAASEDLETDLAVMLQSGFMGTLWIDDLTVEEFDQDPRPAPEVVEPVPGNLFPRCSAEGRRDWLWTSGTYGGAVAAWRDARCQRADGGHVGEHCLAIPGGDRNFTSSYLLPVAPGHRYTFSAWLRSDLPAAQCYIGVTGKTEPTDKGKGLSGRGIALTGQWQRFEVTLKDPVPADVHWACVTIVPSQAGEIYADGFQFEVGESATEFAPAHPLELYLDMGQEGGNIVQWGEPLPLRLLAASATGAGNVAAVPVELTITAFPDRVVHTERLTLPVGEEVKHTVEPGRNGLLRVTLSAVDANLAAPNELIAARLPAPREIAPEDSYFGTHITVRPFFISYAHAIGMKWTRFHDACKITKWSDGEPERGKYVWFDEPVQAVRDGGLQILALPDRPPDWAKTDAAATGNVVDVAAFGNWCEAVAAHYRGLIDCWEVWNEPYMPGFFGGSAEQFAQALDAGAAGLRRGNPDATILGFCPHLDGADWAEKVAAVTTARMDVFSFHCYFMNLTGGGTASFAEPLAALRAAAGQPEGTPSWNTEGGFGGAGHNCFYSFLADQRANDWGAAFGSRVWLSTSTSGFDRNFIYTLHQTDTITYHGGLKMLINFDRSITPSAVATAVTAHCMDGLEPVAIETPRPGVAQYSYSGEGRAVWAVFEDPLAEQPSWLDLSRLPNGVRVLDVMGNDPRADGARARIGPSPLFVMSAGMPVHELVAACAAAISA